VDYLVEHPEVGTIRYERSDRAKRIIISVKPKFVKVAIPKRQSFKNAQQFLDSRIEWVKGRVHEIKKQVAKAKLLIPIERENARKILCQRLAELAQKHNFTYNRITIRNQKTRWGSCSSKNNINLNMNLLHLPPDLMDYILLHELVHTRIKSHGKPFWDELETIVPRARKIDKKLKDYQYCLF